MLREKSQCTNSTFLTILMEINSKLKSQCRVCKHNTNHIVKALETVNESNEEYSYTEQFAIVQCLGCENFSFRKEFCNSDSYSYDEESYDPGITTDIYPSITKTHKRLEYQWFLPDIIRKMYNESVDALAAGCKTLAGAGFRAVIEAICLDKSIKSDDLGDKIDDLAKKKFITPNETSRLHSIRFLGNDSIHEMKAPKDDQLELTLYIIEHLLNNIYLIDKQAQNKLTSIIEEYDKFKDVLGVFLNKSAKGDESTLYKIFGKDARRIKKYGQSFEEQLVREINEGAYTRLSIVPIVLDPDLDPKAKPMSPRFIVR